MRRKTTTQQLQNAITNNLLTIEKAEVYNKTTHQTDVISAEKFKDSLDFLCESEIFAKCLGWYYEYDIKENDGYIVDSGYRNQYSEDIVIVYMSIANGVSSENIERTLLFTEEE